MKETLKRTMCISAVGLAVHAASGALPTGISPFQPVNSGVTASTLTPLPAGNNGLGGPAVGAASATGLPTTPAATPPPATVTLISPVNAATVSSGGTVPLMASVSPGANVSQMTFFDGNTFVGSTGTAPFVIDLNSLNAGLHTFTAQAVTPAGTISSVPVSVAVAGSQAANDLTGQIPRPQLSVQLIGPANGEVFLPGTNIALVAAASDVNGTILSVQFFANMTFLGNGVPVVGGAPSQALYAFDWALVPAGAYSVTAVLTDSGGTTSVSRPAVIFVRGP